MTDELYVCPNGHRSSVARLPNHEGVRRCYFCPEVASAEPVLLDDELLADLDRRAGRHNTDRAGYLRWVLTGKGD